MTKHANFAKNNIKTNRMYHACAQNLPYSICRKPCLSAIYTAVYLRMCEICVNTHTHTHTHTFSPPIARASTYLFIRKCARVSPDIFAHFLCLYPLMNH